MRIVWVPQLQRPSDQKPRPCGLKPGHGYGIVGGVKQISSAPVISYSECRVPIWITYPETERGWCARPYYLIRVATHLSLLWLTSGLCTRIEASFAVDTMGRFCRGHKETGPPWNTHPFCVLPWETQKPIPKRDALLATNGTPVISLNCGHAEMQSLSGHLCFSYAKPKTNRRPQTRISTAALSNIKKGGSNPEQDQDQD